MSDFEIRDASPSDAPLIADAILEAVGPDIVGSMAGDGSREDVFAVFETLAKRTDSQYSFQNARIAMLTDGTPAGVCISYDGSLVFDLRKSFFEEARKVFGWNLSEQEEAVIPGETGPDEFYLDTLATIPEFRGRGVARALIQDAKEKASKAGKPLGLLVSYHNPKARKLYESLGFKQVGSRPFAGELMANMRIF